MKVYVFGNTDYSRDSVAMSVVKKIGNSLPDIEFVIVNPNEDVPFADEEEVVIMDAVEGLTEPRILTEAELDKIAISPRNSVHDWDLGFQIKYLRKLKKIDMITLIGLPMESGNWEKQIIALLQTII